MNIKDNFTLRTVRKKIIMVSKIAGLLLIVSYIVATRLPIEQDFLFFSGFVLLHCWFWWLTI